MTATDAERDNAHRAVGRYVVEFSRLIFHMRNAMIDRMTGGGDPMIAMLALGEATARQIADAFFAICTRVAELDPEEEKVARRLGNDVNEEIKRRNDFLHGDWWVGFGRKPSGEGGDPMLWRIKPSRKTEPFTSETLPVAELDNLSEALHALRQHIAEFGDICLGEHPSITLGEEPDLRVRDIFVLREGCVVREGPSATLRKVRYS